MMCNFPKDTHFLYTFTLEFWGDSVCLYVCKICEWLLAFNAMNLIDCYTYTNTYIWKKIQFGFLILNTTADFVMECLKLSTAHNVHIQISVTLYLLLFTVLSTTNIHTKRRVNFFFAGDDCVDVLNSVLMLQKKCFHASKRFYCHCVKMIKGA